MQILILTHSRDNSATAQVIQALEQRGATPIRFDTDHYPTRVQVSSELDAQGRWSKRIRSGKAVLDLDQIDAVWYRRWYVGQHLPVSLADRRAPCINESNRTLYGTVAALPVFQLDRWINVRAADFKEVQTARAAACGLLQPATLYSNDPEQVRAFFAQAPAGVVTKMQSMFAIYEQAQEKVVFTTEVDPEHLDALEGLAYSPMIFQHTIEKAADIRSTVVGDRVLSAILHRKDSASAGIDWRAKGEQVVDHWQPYDLPESVEAKLLALVKSYGLHYSACDFVLNEHGELVFLEINACGEWCWIAEAAGLPVAEAIAELLIERAGEAPI